MPPKPPHASVLRRTFPTTARSPTSSHFYRTAAGSPASSSIAPWQLSLPLTSIVSLHAVQLRPLLSMQMFIFHANGMCVLNANKMFVFHANEMFVLNTDGSPALGVGDGGRRRYLGAFLPARETTCWDR
ncbi:hypothetical protein AAHE18_17G119800 [Arachis hypogaea]